MPISGFNIGKEVALDLVSPTLGIINFGLLTNFTARPLTSRLTSMPITNGGVPVHRVVYGGHEGSFDVDRADGLMDALAQLLEDNYFAGHPESYFMLTETITNPDGTIDEFRYKDVVLQPESHGDWAGEAKVTQRMAFIAARKERA